MSEIEGWLTDAQAALLRTRAAAVAPGGRIVEIGSFRGKSAVELAGAAADGVEVVCIDPHLGSDRGPQEIEADASRGDADFDAFHANLRAAGVDERVRHVREKSQEALDHVEGPIDLLYVDGAHRYGPASDDIVRWGARAQRMLVHDSFSSVGVTLALLRHVTFSSQWRYAGRAGSMAEYVRDGGHGPLRELAQLPWFVRNLVLKVLILARLRRGPWPH